VAGDGERHVPLHAWRAHNFITARRAIANLGVNDDVATDVRLHLLLPFVLLDGFGTVQRGSGNLFAGAHLLRRSGLCSMRFLRISLPSALCYRSRAPYLPLFASAACLLPPSASALLRAAPRLYAQLHCLYAYRPACLSCGCHLVVSLRGKRAVDVGTRRLAAFLRTWDIYLACTSRTDG